MRFNELRAALDAAPAAVKVFFRDDDAGWADEQLLALLDVFEAQRAPIDLAVIPRALTRELALELCARRARGRERLGLHQHGYAHANHEREGRKCEFGAARLPERQAHDVLAGQLRLCALLGPIDPIFTPPWNRCTQATVGALRAGALRVLSRNASAAPLELGALRECAVQVDWCKLTPAAQPDWHALDRQLALAQRSGTLGIMLHHAVMGEGDLEALQELLALLRQNEKVRLSLMREIALPKGQHAGVQFSAAV